jgi:hypothetical protein
MREGQNDQSIEDDVEVPRGKLAFVEERPGSRVKRRAKQCEYSQQDGRGIAIAIETGGGWSEAFEEIFDQALHRDIGTVDVEAAVDAIVS